MINVIHGFILSQNYITAFQKNDKMFIMSECPYQSAVEVRRLTARDTVLANLDLLDIIFSYLDPAQSRRIRLVSRLLVHWSFPL